MADAPLEDWFPAKGIKPSYEDQRALTVETGRRIRVLSQGVGEVTDAGMAEVARSGGEFSEELTAQVDVALIEANVAIITTSPAGDINITTIGA